MNLIALMLACAFPGSAPARAAAAQNVGAKARSSLCEAPEETILSGIGQTNGDAVSVCLEDLGSSDPAMIDQARIAIRWRRDGRTSVWRCAAKQCVDELYYDRYTRPLTTYLTLRFAVGNVRYSMHESLVGDDPTKRDEPPSVTFKAASQDQPDGSLFSARFLLTSPRLQLMDLEKYLEVHR